MSNLYKGVVDTIEHRLSGPAILRACGFAEDGTVIGDESKKGWPPSRILMVERNELEAKVNVIRVAATNMLKHTGRAKTFTITFGGPVVTTHEYGNIVVPVLLVPIHFNPKSKQTRLTALFAQAQGAL